MGLQLSKEMENDSKWRFRIIYERKVIFEITQPFFDGFDRMSMKSINRKVHENENHSVLNEHLFFFVYFGQERLLLVSSYPI